MTFQEIVSERGRRRKKYQDDQDPRKFALDLSIAAIHYDGPNWKDIDNTMTPSVADVPQLGLADWEMIQDDYEWFALETLNTVPLWLFRNRSVPDSYITLNPQALQWTNDMDQISQISTPAIGTVASVVGNRLSWADAYGVGRELRLLTTPNRMMKRLILDAYPGDPPAFITDGPNPSLEFRFILDTPSGPDQPDILINGSLWNRNIRTQTADAVEFQVGGETIFAFARPVYFDADDVGDVGTMVLTRQGGNLIVGIRVPLSFLQGATYPVAIDPTLDLDVAASSDDADEKDNNGSIDLTSSSVELRSHSTASLRRWCGMRWVDSSIAQNDTIDVAHVTVRTTGNDDVIADLHFEDGASPTTFTNTNRDISDRTRTTASVVWDAVDLGTPASVNTPSLVTPLQEVVDSFSPTAFVFIGKPRTSPSRLITFQAFDDAGTDEPRLHIEFTAGAAPTPQYHINLVGLARILSVILFPLLSRLLKI